MKSESRRKQEYFQRRGKVLAKSRMSYKWQRRQCEMPLGDKTTYCWNLHLHVAVELNWTLITNSIDRLTLETCLCAVILYFSFISCTLFLFFLHVNVSIVIRSVVTNKCYLKKKKEKKPVCEVECPWQGLAWWQIVFSILASSPT